MAIKNSMLDGMVPARGGAIVVVPVVVVYIVVVELLSCLYNILSSATTTPPPHTHTRSRRHLYVSSNMNISVYVRLYTRGICNVLHLCMFCPLKRHLVKYLLSFLPSYSVQGLYYINIHSNIPLISTPSVLLNV